MSLNNRFAYLVLAFTLAAALHGAADKSDARMGRAPVRGELTASSGRAIQPAPIAKADLTPNTNRHRVESNVTTRGVALSVASPLGR